MKLTVISGTSGAGKSVALKVLEDIGYYCVDNLPANLVVPLIKNAEGSQQSIAVSLDVRNTPSTQEELTQFIECLRKYCELEILYLDASSTMLIKRYSETRRLHPLNHLDLTLLEAVKAEKIMLEPIIKSRQAFSSIEQIISGPSRSILSVKCLSKIDAPKATAPKQE